MVSFPVGSSSTTVIPDDVVSTLEGVKVFDLTGKAIPILDLWTDRRVVVAFARHFGYKTTYFITLSLCVVCFHL